MKGAVWSVLLLAAALALGWHLSGQGGWPLEGRKTAESVSSEAASAFPVTIENWNSEKQKESQTFAKPPERVIAVWQGPIETLIALGQQDKIVAALGVPDEKYIKEEYRAAYEAIPYKAFDRMSEEAALAMHPDFIVTSWSSAFSSKGMGTTDFWHQRHVHTYIGEMPRSVTHRTVDQEYQFIRDMGRIFGVSSRAEELVSSIQKEVDFVTEKVPKEESGPTVMVLQFMGSQITSWGDQYLQGDIVKRLHGRLLMKATGTISAEDVIEQNPDVIFLMVNEWDYDHMEKTKARLTENPAFHNLKSVREGRVYLLPLYAGQYSAVRTGEGIRIMARGMYPQFYKDGEAS